MSGIAGYEVHPTAYGRPAMQLLASQVDAAKAGDPLAPVLVIVASNYAAVSTRRSLAARPGGVANVSFLTLYRLAERLGAPSLAAAGRKPVSTPVVGQAVRAVLADDPGVLAPVAAHPATELALIAATQELGGLTDSALDAVAACSGRASDVVRIARRVRAGLAPAWYDEHDLLDAATATLLRGAGVGPLVVHLLQDLSPAGARLLQALAERQRVVVNVGVTGEADADHHVLDAHARAGIPVDPIGIKPPTAAAAVSLSDPDEEVRAALRLVTEWMGEGLRLGRVGLFYATRDPYARLLHEQLTAAGLPHNGAPVRDIGDMLFGRTLRRLLALPDHNFRRSDVLAVVTGAPLLDRDGRVPSQAWERISRAAGVVDGEDWGRRLRVFAEEQRRRAGEADHDERDALAEHLRRDATRAEDLAAFVEQLRTDLASVASAGSWQSMVDVTYDLVRRYLGGERHRWGWPEEEQQAADRVEEALDRLGSLDSVGGPPPTVEVFRRALDGELDVALRRVGHFGDGVLVGPVSMAIGLELDRVVILGMAEGSFPPRRLEDSLLPDDERRAARGELALRSERVHDDHRHLLAAIAAAMEATLCFPRGDLRRQGDRAACRWLLADAARLAGRPSLFTDELSALDLPWFRQVPSYASGMAGTELPATAQELRLATMLRDPDIVAAADPVLSLGMQLVRSRRSARFTRFDGNLAGLALPDYTASGVTSATRLQAWAECPHAFFMHYLLGVEVIEDPEHELQMNALDKGSLMHEILDRFVREAIAAGRSPPWKDDDRGRLLAIAAQVAAEYGERGATGRAMFWRRDLAGILADLERFAAEDDGHPIYSEYSFREAGYRLPDGRSVRLNGAADRVDRFQDGSLRVIDYKTGAPRWYLGLSPEDPHQAGTRLQLALYGGVVGERLRSPDVDARYWFITARGDFAWIGYQLTPQIQNRVGDAVTAVVSGIHEGVFPRRPPADPAYGRVDCWYCSPDGMSSAEARREWERKRLDPALDRYVRLCEPEVLDDLG
jgi:ATP-dependent helicase/nuclease subunit B